MFLSWNTTTNSLHLKSCLLVLALLFLCRSYTYITTSENGAYQHQQEMRHPLLQKLPSTPLSRKAEVKAPEVRACEYEDLSSMKNSVWVDTRANFSLPYDGGNVPVQELFKPSVLMYDDDLLAATTAIRDNYIVKLTDPPKKRDPLLRAQSRMYHTLLLPRNVISRSCTLPKLKFPFPAGAVILFMGNSHFNQLLQSILLRHEKYITSQIRRRAVKTCGKCHIDIAKNESLAKKAHCRVDFLQDLGSGQDKRNRLTYPRSGSEWDERVLITHFSNGAVVYSLINSPLFYVYQERFIKNVLNLFGLQDLSTFTHVLFSVVNNLKFARGSLALDCPCMRTPKTFGVFNSTNVFEPSVDCGVKKMPNTSLFMFQLMGNSFRGKTMLQYRKSLRKHTRRGNRSISPYFEKSLFQPDVEKWCGRSEEEGRRQDYQQRVSPMKIRCWDHYLRVELDSGSPFDCIVDKSGHVCQPGPIDAIADWGLWLLNLI